MAESKPAAGQSGLARLKPPAAEPVVAGLTRCRANLQSGLGAWSGLIRSRFEPVVAGLTRARLDPAPWAGEPCSSQNLRKIVIGFTVACSSGMEVEGASSLKSSLSK